MRLDSTHSQDRKTYRTTKELQTSYVAVGNLKGDDVNPLPPDLPVASQVM